MPKPQRLPRGVDRLPGGGYRARLTVDGYQHTIGSFATLGDARLALIAIAMGTLGTATRICGEAMGSCLTFGTAGEASAPGQMDAKALRQALKMVHEAMNKRK